MRYIDFISIPASPGREKRTANGFFKPVSVVRDGDDLFIYGTSRASNPGQTEVDLFVCSGTARDVPDGFFHLATVGGDTTKILHVFFRLATPESPET